MWRIMSRVFLTPWCILLLHGASVVDADKVSVMEGDSVTLNTDVKTKQEDIIMWYFKNALIALIIGNQSKICTDDQCHERFRDRLKLDNVTASLTITNINTTDCGLYLQINNHNHEKVFDVAVHDVPADKIKSVKEGEPVTLDPGVMNDPNSFFTWIFNDVYIAEIKGDPSKICTDVQCQDGNGRFRFRDRLKVNQTGFLTIMNTRTTDSGEYQLQVISSSFSITRIRSLKVTVTGSGLSPGAIAGISAAVLVLLMAAAAALFYFQSKGTEQNQVYGQHSPVPQNETQSKTAANGISHNQTANGTPA